MYSLQGGALHPDPEIHPILAKLFPGDSYLMQHNELSMAGDGHASQKIPSLMNTEMFSTHSAYRSPILNRLFLQSNSNSYSQHQFGQKHAYDNYQHQPKSKRSETRANTKKSRVIQDKEVHMESHCGSEKPCDGDDAEVQSAQTEKQQPMNPFLQKLLGHVGPIQPIREKAKSVVTKVTGGAKLVSCRSNTGKSYFRIEYDREAFLKASKSPLARIAPTCIAEVAKTMPEILPKFPRIFRPKSDDSYVASGSMY